MKKILVTAFIFFGSAGYCPIANSVPTAGEAAGVLAKEGSSFVAGLWSNGFSPVVSGINYIVGGFANTVLIPTVEWSITKCGQEIPAPDSYKNAFFYTLSAAAIWYLTYKIFQKVCCKDKPRQP